MLNNLPKVHIVMGFPGSSAGKESTCNPGDPSSIPQLRRSPGEGDGYTLQYKESDKTEQHSFTQLLSGTVKCVKLSSNSKTTLLIISKVSNKLFSILTA